MDNPPENGPCEVTITAPDREWLQAFVRQLVEDRLAAAAHVDAMHTTYRWAGDVHEADEARAVLHTTMRRVSIIEGLLHEQHPFEVPCLVATPMTTGGSTYLAWVDQSASDTPSE